jgi:hypothetical protein
MARIGAVVVFPLVLSAMAAGQRTQATRPAWQQIQKLGSPADAEPPPAPAVVHATPAQLQEQAGTLADLCHKVSAELSNGAHPNPALRTQLKQIQ